MELILTLWKSGAIKETGRRLIPPLLISLSTPGKLHYALIGEHQMRLMGIF